MDKTVCIVQFAPILGDVAANIQLLSQRFQSAWESDLVVLPELASSGYRFSCRDEAMACAGTLQDSAFVEFLKQQAETNGCCIVSGFNERYGDDLFNSSILVQPDGVIHLYRKLHLFWDEKDIFTPGNLGVNVFDTPVGRVGMLICFDWMFPEVWRMMALKGAQVVCHPSNLVLPSCQSVVPSYALVNRYYVVTANRIGKERDLLFTGGSLICSPKGSVMVSGSSDQEHVLFAGISPSLSDDKQVTPRNHALDHRRKDVYGNFE